MEKSTASIPATVHEGNLEQSMHEDIEEGIHRMMDEGGGVVSQTGHDGKPILRNDLVDAHTYTS